MLFNLPSSTRLTQLCFPIAASLLLFAPGCGRDKNCSSCSSCTSVASDSSTYRSYETPPPAYVAPAPAVATYNDAGSQGLRGPRSQAELDAIFNSQQLSQLPPPPPRRPVQPNAPPPDNVVILQPGDASWGVPVGREWKHIVIHHSASATGSAASFDRAHRDKGWDGLGYHFVIGNGSGSGDGQVEVGYRWAKQMQGAHAGNYEYNQHGIGICLVGDFEHAGPPSARQMASLRTLVAFLQARANIPTNEIIGHGNVPGRNTECPGRYLSMPEFRASINSAYLQRSSTASAAGKQSVVQVAATSTPDAKPSLVKTIVTP